MRNWLSPYSRALLLITLLMAGTVHAQQFDIHGPAGSVAFGTGVNVLPNGNVVVADPSWSGNTGAVYLYSPDGKTLISKLTGSNAGDKIGSRGITVLSNGNYVVDSPNWMNPSSGGTSAGAVTLCHASTGCGPSAVVGLGNSLIGTSPNDEVGEGGVTALSNGNYVVNSELWNNNGGSAYGAVTWCDGITGMPFGNVSGSNSLVGGMAGDSVGNSGSSEVPAVVPLDNGNFVVVSPYWTDPAAPAVQYVGAVTWANGSSGLTGTVSESNSLYGTAASDEVGIGGVIALVGGRYVVNSYLWGDNVSGSTVGAVTWADNSGIVGAVDHTNSLYGTHLHDQIGLGGAVDQGVVALANGNYVVTSDHWNSSLGAVTWGGGTGGISGAVDGGTNSLVGTGADDEIGYSIAALSNGNYVIASPYWSGDKGAVTWLDGTMATIGTNVSSANSLVGSTTSDYVGLNGVFALKNGNYVALSPFWNTYTGAATWGNGSAAVKGTKGFISSGNSLIGNSTNSNFANDDLVALSNGNYVVVNRFAFGNKGAVAWGNGATGTIGTLSAANALIGTTAGDQVGWTYPLSNGNYVIVSSNYSNGATAGVGAVTWGNGRTGIKGSISATNSVIGTTAQDIIGATTGMRRFFATANGNYIFASSYWSRNGATSHAGAVTLQRGNGAYAGMVDGKNSVLGVLANSGNSMVFDYDAGHDQLVVGRPAENIVSLLRTDELFKNGFEVQ
jgi:hypothetical protein